MDNFKNTSFNSVHSQFGDIYQEEYFINILKDEINIVKELPPHQRSLDIEALGSLVCCPFKLYNMNKLHSFWECPKAFTLLLQITDADLLKEAKPADYIRSILPLLLRNEIVHFLGFGNRLGFDPLPSKLQVIRIL